MLFPDGRVETAYRGELREGDHAEFTLLERKFPNENLEGCILYTTLEPCMEWVGTESSLLPGARTQCCRIKKVFIGIEDKDPKGKGIKHLEKHGVEYKMFDREFQRVIEEENIIFSETSPSTKN